ncbi:MAG: hypothetical protein QOD88_717, partial [Mycobacterium sp.]|nr:hypothetical protein [Mycobacterium sp.]
MRGAAWPREFGVRSTKDLIGRANRLLSVLRRAGRSAEGGGLVSATRRRH